MELSLIYTDWLDDRGRGIAGSRIEAHSGDEGKITTVLVEVPLLTIFRLERDWRISIEKPAHKPGARSLNFTRQQGRATTFNEK